MDQQLLEASKPLIEVILSGGIAFLVILYIDKINRYVKTEDFDDKIKKSIDSELEHYVTKDEYEKSINASLKQLGEIFANKAVFEEFSRSVKDQFTEIKLRLDQIHNLLWNLKGG